MEKTIKTAIKLDKFNTDLPILEVGNIVTLGEVWDGSGEVPKGGCCYIITDTGEDGSNVDVSINYEFEIVEEKDSVLDTLVKITDIYLI